MHRSEAIDPRDDSKKAMKTQRGNTARKSAKPKDCPIKFTDHENSVSHEKEMTFLAPKFSVSVKGYIIKEKGFF